METSRLTLKAGGIGPIETGTPANEALGRLVASLGIPEEVGVAGTDHGLCEGDDGRYARWAQLTVIVLGTVADGTFVGYRYQEPTVPTSLINLATPSGIRLGDDIAALNETYASFTITYETVAGATTLPPLRRCGASVMGVRCRRPMTTAESRESTLRRRVTAPDLICWDTA